MDPARSAVIPEIADLERQQFLALDPAQRPMMETALKQVQDRLETVDKTDLQQYSMILQQVVMIKRRLAASVTTQSLLQQKIAILEPLANQ
jgi:hypothetical protein